VCIKTKQIPTCYLQVERWWRCKTRQRAWKYITCWLQVIRPGFWTWILGFNAGHHCSILTSDVGWPWAGSTLSHTAGLSWGLHLWTQHLAGCSVWKFSLCFAALLCDYCLGSPWGLFLLWDVNKSSESPGEL
jgi:hypothetical protein